MAFDKITRCLGLITQYNPLEVQPGALARANDCVITRENVLQDRRGYGPYGTLSGNVLQYMTYGNRVIAHDGASIYYDDGSGTFAAYSGSYMSPAGVKIRFSEAFSNLYVTSTVGIRVFTDIAGTAARNAGSPRSLDPSIALSGSSGFLATGMQSAYRVVIKRTDANGNVIFGYPSTREVISNASGGGRNVSIVLPLPAEITISDVIQVYRTAQATIVGTEDVSGDEMALVYQINPTSAEVLALSMAFVDSIDDSLRGAALYTSPSQEGIDQANDRPPVAKDVALYKSNFMMYANTKTKQRLQFAMVGTAGLTGHTITVAGATYQFNTTEDATVPRAAVSATGIAAVDIDLTARSLVRVINKYASNTSVYAYYLSGPSDLPGQIMIEERGVGASAFTIQSSDTTILPMFFPPPPVSPATNTASTSSNSIQLNALYYSKDGQPEAVPILNYLLVGSANEAILRAFALRDSLIVIKDRSVWRITGDNPSSFVATLVDNTVYCKSANSCALLANQVFMLSNQGVVAVSETGVQVVSREIEPNILPLLSFSAIASITTGFAYESDRHFFLSVPTTAVDTTQNQTYVYNIFTRTWVRWTFGVEAGIVEATADKLFFSKPGSVSVYRERKNFSDDDFRDPELVATITSIVGTAVVFTVAGGSAQAGYQLSQGGNAVAIDSIDSAGGTYTAVLVSTPPDSWTTGVASLFPSVGFDVEWQAWFAGGEGVGRLKQIRQVAILADNISGNNSATQIAVTFRSNLDENAEEKMVQIQGGSWGNGPWGAFPWGGSGDPYGYPRYVPRNKQYCRLLNIGVKHRLAGEKLACTGVAIAFEIFGENFNR